MRNSVNTHAQTSTNTPWFTLDQGAEYAQTSGATLRREIRAGTLRHARIGGRKVIRLRPEWIDQWLERSTINTPDSPVAA